MSLLRKVSKASQSFSKNQNADLLIVLGTLGHLLSQFIAVFDFCVDLSLFFFIIIILA